MEQEYVYLYSSKEFGFHGNINLMRFEVKDIVNPRMRILRYMMRTVRADEGKDEFERGVGGFICKHEHLIDKIQMTKKHLEDMPAWARESFNMFMENKEVKKALKKIILENQ